ncbi:hypothetical protein ABIE78_003824 [Sinorhizobium fredii]|uniref:Uncharacterized protein n=1 Tax=Sinorhizobium fredii (strain USDA 257) TaxID=1185652 RepID=I3X3C1_SINF2|nr:hypothetical protein [Sinorhizobium fredii]AFL50377.1 hypothetical protein USDA257_c17890 [Sinorhizobium fredii USDA 257]
MTSNMDKGCEKAPDLSARYRPIALKAVLAAYSIGSAKAKPMPLRQEFQHHPGIYGNDED